MVNFKEALIKSTLYNYIDSNQFRTSVKEKFDKIIRFQVLRLIKKIKALFF